MKEEISNIIEDELKKINPSLEDMYNEGNQDVAELVEDQNTKLMKEKEYRDSLIKQIEEIKKLGIDIEYNDNTSIEELENMINKFQF